MVGEIVVPEWDDIPAEIQKHLIDKRRYSLVDYDWWDTGEDWLKESFRHMGLMADTIYFRIHDQSAGACVVGNWEYPYESDDKDWSFDGRSELKDIKDAFDKMGTLMRLRFPTMSLKFKMRNNTNRLLQSHASVVYKTQWGQLNDIGDGPENYDDPDEVEIIEYARDIDLIGDTRELLYNLDRYILRYFEEEYEYLTSDEAVIDHIIANDLYAGDLDEL